MEPPFGRGQGSQQQRSVTVVNLLTMIMSLSVARGIKGDFSSLGRKSFTILSSSYQLSEELENKHTNAVSHWPEGGDPFFVGMTDRRGGSRSSFAGLHGVRERAGCTMPDALKGAGSASHTLMATTSTPFDCSPFLDENHDDGPNTSSQEPLIDRHSLESVSYFSGMPAMPLPPSISATTTMSSNAVDANTIPGEFPVRDLNYYLPLYKASLKGDWKRARSFLALDPDALTARISFTWMTALQVAASAGQSGFVEELVEFMPAEALPSLAFQDVGGYTALHLAAMSGITKAAKALVAKNRNLPQIQNNAGRTPLHEVAAYPHFERKEMLWYLCEVIKDEDPSPFTGPLGAQLLCNIVAGGFYDIALYLVQRYPHLATARDDSGITALYLMAQTPFAFLSGSRLGFWQRCIYSCCCSCGTVQLFKPRHKVGDMENPSESSGDLAAVSVWFKSRIYPIQVSQWLNRLFWKVIEQLVPGIKHIRDTKVTHIYSLELVKCIRTQILCMNNSMIWEFFTKTTILGTAVIYGNVELVMECFESFPDIFWASINGRNTFQKAVEHRREKIFNLVYGMNARKIILLHGTVLGENTLLHLVAKLAPSPQLTSVSGAALQMQRELQWFNEVEKLVPPFYKVRQNGDGKTARAIFTEEHEKLVEKGEKWMKDTAQSCMVVSTLIATVVFAAAFTVPGGNSSDRGIPIFLRSNSFKVFVVADVLALLSSVTSVLMFLSILTSRYAEEDFLKSLPNKLIIGLATLFFSIATMMIAFTATLSIILSHQWEWVSIPISVFACLPVTLFAMLQFPLFVEIIWSTHGPGIFKPDKKFKLD
ncbi:hypothetical protein HHK36_025411 [Tetracentron sinense]|uniref:PGG domain-containing protein n=1 Tax=Tetracentron sinense TaxID=13715 RepID=A0A834YN51_TETSI|nr:hypothetical protein HHK36_025411 [Tetracentron sinense]